MRRLCFELATELRNNFFAAWKEKNGVTASIEIKKTWLELNESRKLGKFFDAGNKNEELSSHPFD